MTSMKGRHFITEQDWTKEEIDRALELSTELKEKKKRGEITNWLENQTVTAPSP